MIFQRSDFLNASIAFSGLGEDGEQKVDKSISSAMKKGLVKNKSESLWLPDRSKRSCFSFSFFVL